MSFKSRIFTVSIYEVFTKKKRLESKPRRKIPIELVKLTTTFCLNQISETYWTSKQKGNNLRERNLQKKKKLKATP